MPQSVGIYIRVSTQEQALEGYSIEAQTDRLETYCKAKEWKIHKTYIDGGFSGSNIKRPAMQQLIDDIKSKLVDCVLVYKLDRLSRSQKDTLFLIEDLFLKNDVEFVSMNENFDTSTPFGRATIGMLSVFAQLEREQIKERSLMGRTERAKAGLWHGGGFRPFGYEYVNGQLIINEYEAIQVKEIYDLYLKNFSIFRITSIIQEKYNPSQNEQLIRSILTTPLYKGFIRWNGAEYPGKHNAIVDEFTYAKAEKKYNSTKWHRHQESVSRPFQVTHLLGSIMYCENCGARYCVKGNYSGRGANKKYRPYYYCYSRSKTAKKYIVDPTCMNPSYPVSKLDNIIIAEIKKLAVDDKNLLEAKSADEAPCNENPILEKQIKELDKQISRLLDLYQLGVVSMEDISARVTPLQDKKNMISARMSQATSQCNARLSIPEVKKILKNIDETFKNGTFLDKRNVIMSLIKNIVVKKETGNLKINWNF